MLALDTSTRMGSVGVGTADEVFAEVSVSVGAGHSSALMPAVDDVLRSAGLRAADLGGVVVGGGPGSFTGLRIAGATAKGIVHALDLPLYAFSSLLATAVQAASAPGPVCALFDARGRDVYAATYRFTPVPETVAAPAVLTLDEVIGRYSNSEPAVFVGDGAVRHREELHRQLGARVLDAHFGWPRATALIWLSAVMPRVGLVSSPATWEPEYLRASGAERIAATRNREESSR